VLLLKRKVLPEAAMKIAELVPPERVEGAALNVDGAGIGEAVAQDRGRAGGDGLRNVPTLLKG